MGEREIIALLRGVTVFATLGDDLLERLARGVREVSVKQGEWLMREGDSADGAYVISAGRLEVVAERPTMKVMHVLRHGAVVGEMALLRPGATRAASVRAKRDTQLIEIPRPVFEALLHDSPEFSLHLLRGMADLLARSRVIVPQHQPVKTIAVIALDQSAPQDLVVESIAGELQTAGKVEVLSAGISDEPLVWTAMLTRAEEERDWVILLADSSPGQSNWRDHCLRDADLIVAISSGSIEPALLSKNAVALEGCDLLLLDGRKIKYLEDSLSPRDVRVASTLEQCERDAARIGRQVAGKAVGIVLSGGGARALAHLGVVEELLRAGLVIDRIAGASLGAMIAALYATGRSSDEVYQVCKHSFVESKPTNDYILPVWSLIRGGKARRLVEEALGEDTLIEALPIPFFCVSCDLVGRDLVVHRTGGLVEAVFASMALPAIFPPVTTGGRLLVDGGVLDNLPITTMARLPKEGPIIAIDIAGQGAGLTHRHSRPTRPVIRSIRKALTGSEIELPRLSETLISTLTIGSADAAAAGRHYADLVITPDVHKIGLLEWKRLPEIREIGRRAAHDYMEQVKQLL